MATVTRADLSLAMSLLLMDGLDVQFRRDVPIVNLLPINNKGKNDTLTWTPKFAARSAGGAYTEGADMSDADFDSHDRRRASLNWAQYRKGAKVSGLAQALSAQGNYVGSTDLFDEELEDAIHDLAKDIGADIYGGNPDASPIELAGAAIAIDNDTSSSFANIDPATYSTWVGNENSIASADLTIENLRTKLHRPIKDATGRDPDFVTCPGALWDKVQGLVDDRDKTVHQVTINGEVVDLARRFGGKAVVIDGVPYIEDRQCTANTFYAWTVRYVEIVQVPAAKPRADMSGVVAAMKMLTGVDVEVDDIVARLRQMYSSGRLIPFVEMLAQNGDAYKAQVKLYLQLKWRRRNAFGKLVLT